MRSGVAWVSFVITAACGGTSSQPAPAAPTAEDDCAVVARKSLPTLRTMAGDAPEPGRDAETVAAQLVERCRADGRFLDDPVFQCVRVAADEDAAAACWREALTSYAAAGKQSEARVQLRVLAKAAQVYLAEHGELPLASAPLTPAVACCDQPNQVCAFAEADWRSEAWALLDYVATVDEGRYQYGFDSDGDVFTARAVGTTACGTPPETLEVTVRRDDPDPALEVRVVP